MRFSMKERKIIFKEYAHRYKKARKREKQRMLDELEQSTECSRDYIAWMLRNHGKKVQTGQRTYVVGDVTKRVKQRIKPKKYGEDCREALEFFWILADTINSKRLQSVLPIFVEKYKQYEKPRFREETLQKICTMSHGTIDTLLQKTRLAYKNKRYSHTKTGFLLKRHIPVRTFADWNEKKPGFLEMDLVAHEGGNASGEFCFSFNLVDIQTCWSEFCAIRNKAHTWIIASLDTIGSRLPFPILGVDSDCGAEFINHAMLKYCNTNNITFTRGRSYRKNDNCYIEQKNSSVIRKAVYHGRYDTDTSLVLLNELYDRLRLYVNYFMPCSKLLEKTHDMQKGKTIRKRDAYKTPYQRVLEDSRIDDTIKKGLTQIFDRLNPFLLKKEIASYQDKLIKEASQSNVKNRLPYKIKA